MIYEIYVVIFAKNNDMIHTTSHIRLTKQEIIEFRENVHRCMSKNFTYEHKVQLRCKKYSIAKIRQDIDKNNGGKNPLLGY